MPNVEKKSMTVKKISVMKTDLLDKIPIYKELFSKELPPKP